MSGLTLVYATAVGALLSGAVALLERALRDRRRPARALWLVAMAVTLGAPWWGPVLARDDAGPSVVARGAAYVATPGSPGGGAAPTGLRAGLRDIQDAAAVVGRRLGEPRAAVPLAWGVAAATALGLVLITLARLHRRVARWPRARVGGDPVVVSPKLGPACVGLLHPRVVLPRWALGLPRPELDLVMRHERAHADAADPLLLAAGMTLAAAAPWNPVLWWQLTRLRRATELDCDARVLDTGADAASYGRTLVGLVRRSRPAGFAAAALVEPPSFLERRLRLMRSDTRPRRTATLAALAGAALLVILACETPPPTELQDAESGVATFTVEEVSVEPVDVTLVVDGVIVARWTADEPVPAQATFDPTSIRELNVTSGPGERTIEVVTKGAAGDASPEAADGWRGQLERIGGTLRRVREAVGDPAGPDAAESANREAASMGLEGARIRLRETEPGPGAGAPRPLIVVDGVLSDIPMGELSSRLDIEAIEVLKGGAARGLYGERATGGVVWITTRDGGGEVR